MTTVVNQPPNQPNPPSRSMSVSDNAARTLANATKTVPQMASITPRWLVHLMSWVPVEAGIYRVNKVVHPESVHIECDNANEAPLPDTFVDYAQEPREYRLKAVQTVLDLHTRIADLYSSPHDQTAQQLRLTIEAVKEHQEGELINSPDYGMLSSVAPTQRISTLAGPPTPDDLDALITKVWKQPAFFLTHPEGVAAFGRECTRRGVPPATVSMFGSQFLTWRGLPIIPSDKVPLENGRTKFLLLRTGESRQGVVGLFQPGLAGEQGMGLSVRFMQIDRSAIASYLVSLYCSLAVLTEDALAVLDDVEVDKFHDYAPSYR
ncbi:family 2A encapsulin nanocompartment shell protein [Streptomyces graminilatus]|uniref:family 2A encapsulin nanocompartment shell protein n=1 Tax=Streptomyces graminilatus TaxID=1464070 RepID=UPI000A4720F9|nr:family 2A encapsulin nanocompartment shell protein [Streptomyces graminilatus]